MEKSHLHVSFDDGFSSTPRPDKKPDFTERKKSILASANNRITENKSLLEDSSNSGEHPFKDNQDKMDSKQDSLTQSKLPVFLGTSPPAQRTTSTTSPPQIETKSKIPVSYPNDNPLRNMDVKTSTSDNNSSKTANEVPIEIALKGFIGQPKQTYDVKIPRFNPNSESKDTKSDKKEGQNSIEVPSDSVKDEKNPCSPPKEVSIEKSQLTVKGDELLLLEELQESPFNRRRHSPKHSKSKDKDTKTNTGLKDAAKDATDATTVTMTDIIEPPKGPGTAAPIPIPPVHQVNKNQPGFDESIKNDQAKAKEEVKSKLLLKSAHETDDKSPKTDTVEEAESAKSNTRANKSDKNSSETGKSFTETKESTNKEKNKRDEANKKHILERKKEQSDTDSLKALKKTNDLKNNKNKSDKTKMESSTVIVSTRGPTPNPPNKHSKGKPMEKKSSKEKLSVPPAPNHIQSADNEKMQGSPPSAPGTPRKEKLSKDKIKSIVKSSRDANAVRSPKRSPTRNDPKNTKPSDFKPEKLETTLKIENEMGPVTTRDINVESTEEKQVEEKKVTKTDDEEAKESADTILNELGDKPKSILARAALKKIAARATKPGQAQQNGDVKHVSVNDSLNQSKSSGKFALSVPAKGKKDSEDKDDKTSLGSRRDSKYSIDTTSRKSIDIRMQNHVLLGNKPAEEKPKSPLTNTDSWIRSAIPHLPLGVAVLCLLLNILIPGSGTMLSGVAILCCGRPRVNSKDDHVIVTICVNVWVGLAQLFTITFLLVGWFWSLAWGIRMIILAVEYRREQQLQREKQLQTMALSAFGSASHMRSLF